MDVLKEIQRLGAYVEEQKNMHKNRITELEDQISTQKLELLRNIGSIEVLNHLVQFIQSGGNSGQGQGQSGDVEKTDTPATGPDA